MSNAPIQKSRGLTWAFATAVGSLSMLLGENPAFIAQSTEGVIAQAKTAFRLGLVPPA